MRSTPPRQTSSAALERYLACPSQRSSVALGWESMIVRCRVEPPLNDYLFIPGTPDPWLVLVTSGRRRVEVRDGPRWRGTSSGRGQVAVTSPGTVTEIRWRTDIDSPFETVHIHLEAGLFHRFATEVADCDRRRVELIDALAEIDPLIEQVGTALARELQSPTMAGRLFRDAAAQLLTVHLLRHHCAFPIVPARSAGALSDRKLRQVRDYVEAHMDVQITLDHLAQVAGLSSYHFARMFKRASGETPHGFVRRLKLERAKRLLRESDWDVSRVARVLGFSSASHFSAMFQRHTGTTPTVFRSLGR
jgi:AraC family transcriptional regulator